MDKTSEAFLQFLESLIHQSAGSSLTCANPESQCHLLVSSFVSSPAHKTLYVSIYNEDFVLSYEFPTQGRELDYVIVVLKLGGPITHAKLILSQVNVVNIPTSHLIEENYDSKQAYEQIQSLILSVVVPYFDFSLQNDPAEVLSSATQVSIGTKKKFNELAISLAYLRQRVQVPVLLSSVPENIKEVLTKASLSSEVSELSLDSALLNELTRIMNGWIRQIQQVTNLTSSRTESVSLLDELQFWKSMEAGLLSLQSQLAHPMVKSATEILNSAKRFQVSLAFKNNLELENSLAEVSSFNALLRDLPIEEIVYKKESPLDLPSYDQSIDKLFLQLKRWKGSSAIPIPRMLQLMDQIVVEVVEYLCHIFTSLKLFFLPNDEFDITLHSTILPILSKIEENVKFMENIFRELVRKRLESFFVAKINKDSLILLKERTLTIERLRGSYEQTQLTLGYFEGLNYCTDNLETAFTKNCASSSVFDFSKQGMSAWSLDQKTFLQVLRLVEHQISSLFHGLLDDCETFLDYNSVFNSFTDSEGRISVLLVSLVDDTHKLKILDRAHLEIKKVVSLSRPYESKDISRQRDFDSRKYISQELYCQSKLTFFTESLSSMLGPTWMKYSTGINIIDEVKSTLELVELKIIFKEWLKTEAILASHLKSDDGLLIIKSKGADLDPEIVLNDSSKVYDILEEAQDFILLKFDIPVSMILSLDRLFISKPYVHILTEHMELFESILLEISTQAALFLDCGYLLHTQIESSTSGLEEIMKFSWSKFYQELSILTNQNSATEGLGPCLKAILNFQDEVCALYKQYNTLLKSGQYIHETCYNSLRDCDSSRESIEKTISLIQQEVDILKRENYFEFGLFVESLNRDIAQLLLARCQQELEDFIQDLQSRDQIRKLQCIHQIYFKDDAVQVQPPLDSSRTSWIEGINDILNTFSNLRNISVSSNSKYLNFDKFNDLSNVIASTLANVDTILLEAKTYWRKWINFSRVLHKEIELFFESNLNALAELKNWMTSVQVALSYLKVLDIPEGKYEIQNAITFNFKEIQPHLLARFEVFKGALLLEFERRLQASASLIHKQLVVGEKRLTDELKVNVESKAFFSNVMEVFRLEDSSKDWISYVALYSQCQIFMSKQGKKVLANWVFAEELESKLSNFLSLLQIQNEAIKSHSEIIQLQLKSACSATQEAFTNMRNDWEKEKPISHDLEPYAALSVIIKFQSILKDFELHAALLKGLGAHFNMSLPLVSAKNLSEELATLRDIWSELHGVWDALNENKSQLWATTDPISIKNHLKAVLAKLRSCSPTVRLYSAFGDLERLINALLTKVPMIMELKSDSMKERHWNKLFKIVATKEIVYDKMTVDDVLNLNFLAYETTIRSVVELANGEKLVEDALKGILDEWSTIVFETFSFEGKCRLVRNWKVLFDQCQSCLATLVSMKNSAYCKPFENTRESLEFKISDLLAILNVWVEVQSHWIYLHGVFGFNSEMKASLPLESTRFHNISLEFLSLLKRALNVDLVLDIVQIKNIKESLMKIHESLQNTKKGLFEYLDKQRDLFPRFYFVGNDDLLELLGCSSNFTLLNKHINLMFTGIDALVFDSNKTSVLAVMSPQGEVLELSNAMTLTNLRSLADWMTQLELEIKKSVSYSIKECLKHFQTLDLSNSSLNILEALKKYPIQAIIVALQCQYSTAISNYRDDMGLKRLLEKLQDLLKHLKSYVFSTSDKLDLSKARCLIVEILHHENTITSMLEELPNNRESILRSQQLYFFDFKAADELSCLKIEQSRFEFGYGFEYQGVTDRLAVTPLVQNCYLAMTQAISQKIGGSPVGPAGTGKTECVKALGHNLGRMVIVFCCDESFDFQSMGRIMLGISRVGCWGCFDELNRLNPNILSSISALIESISHGKQEPNQLVELNGKYVSVHPETGIFVTMNPSYAGRNELPENLKRHFRAFSMEEPESVSIAQMILTSHGFIDSRALAQTLVEIFKQLSIQLTAQSHYDFGLRTLKSVLNVCGTNLSANKDKCLPEMAHLSKALRAIISPKLTKEDAKEFDRIMSENFSNDMTGFEEPSVTSELVRNFLSLRGIEASPTFLKKAIQVIDIQRSHHGFMVFGRAGSGKSVLIELALAAFSEHEGTGFEKITIDSKTLSKDQIYGSLDPTTREWTDGLFTRAVRRVLNDLKGETHKQLWIVFDGDIDPEWAENLNSVLDDNKILTLPNGERLKLPSNVRIVFEVDNLNSATPATISRCGMVWIDHSLVSKTSLLSSLVYQFKQSRLERFQTLDDLLKRESIKVFYDRVAEHVLEIMDEAFIAKIEQLALKMSHIMDFLAQRTIHAVVRFLAINCDELEPLASETEVVYSHLEFTKKILLLALGWAYSGDCSPAERREFSKQLINLSDFADIDAPENFMDCHLEKTLLDWRSWSEDVADTDLEPHQVLDSTTIVHTIDTVVHESIIRGVLESHAPLILCGPPGSGKTMTLLRSLRDLPDFDFISLNFSKDFTSESLIMSLEEHCEYQNNISGSVLAPKVSGKWVVVFCDEINLPSLDKFGTQKTISFLRQLVEKSGFWRPRDQQWVAIRNIQFVGACNDPKDPGRNSMSERFLRHVTILKIDHPSAAGMVQIYKAFNSASLKCAPNIRHFTGALTEAMLDAYGKIKERLTSSIRAHYVYSPRELTRWCRGILRVLMADRHESIGSLIQIFFHEAMRLFYDRIVEPKEKMWCKSMLIETAEKHFPIPGVKHLLEGPLLFSSWLSGNYQLVDEIELTKFIRQRMKVFSEEELNVKIVLYQDLLDHILRIDRVLRQPQGHMMLVGASASGKSTLVKFVSWMNGLKLVQLRVQSGYTVHEFEAALRSVLISCAKGVKVCFLVDESCVLETAFLERMNSLLANSEIPGLFEGEELDSLHAICASESASQGMLLENLEELSSWFTRQVSENLHVVLTVSDMENGKSAQFQSSPALFNRCVVNWMGNWSSESLHEVASNILSEIPLDQSDFIAPATLIPHTDHAVQTYRDAVVDSLVAMHHSVSSFSHLNYPSKFLKFNELAVQLFVKWQFELEQNQRCIGIGLVKLKETALDVNKTEKVLLEKRATLSVKMEEAKKMLNNMILNQNEAERKKEFSEDAQIEIKKQEREIELRREVVMRNLEAVEPAVLEAQRGVQNIKKQHLTEIRSMSNPPAAVKMTLESVCTLLGYQASTWREVQLIIRKDDFISSIVDFDSEAHLLKLMKEYMLSTYLSRSDYNFEAVNRASQACGPLIQWVIAQLRYFSILEKIEPLRQEVNAIEDSANKSKTRLIVIAQMIDELEESIEKYKNEYSEVIGQVENTKVELAQIEEKVNRSKQLITNLTSERQKWQESIKLFQRSRNQLAGNSILAAAFATYCGGLSQRDRSHVVLLWRKIFDEHGIEYERDISLPTLLAPGRKSIEVQLHNDLLMENLAIETWNDVPLVIDPLNYYNEHTFEKFSKAASFLDETFLRTLEDTLRFGGNLLLRNVECYNPVMDSLIRNEFASRGGQKTIQLGEKTTVVLGNCTVVLYSKDDRLDIPSFLESRVCLLNFSVTEGNLENSILNSVLLHTYPDLLTKRSEIISLQGEYNSRALQLRQRVLDLLNECKGTMLENNHVIDSLENLKTESSEIDSKMLEASSTLSEVDEKRLGFQLVALHVRSIYQILAKFASLDKFYNFSFELFFKSFETALHGLQQGLSIELLIPVFYKKFLKVYSCCFKKIDRKAFFVCMAISYCNFSHSYDFLTGAKMILSNLGNEFEGENWLAYLKSCELDLKENVSLENWRTILETTSNPISQHLIPLLDKYIPKKTQNILSQALDDFLQGIFNDCVSFKLDWNLILKHNSPTLFSMSRRYDVSSKLEVVAKEFNKSLVDVPMGSRESTGIAMKALNSAALKGNWVLLQNIQLSSSWLLGLEKWLNDVDLHEDFKLFMSCSLNSQNIPNGLIQLSSVVTIEELPSFQVNLFETFQSVSKDEVSSFQGYVYFLLSFYNAIIQERLKYVPLAFSNTYDINDSEFEASKFMLLPIFEKFDGSDVASFPWSEVAYRIGKVIFGGKMNNKTDADYCFELARYLFSPCSTKPDFNLVKNPITDQLGLVLQSPKDKSPKGLQEFISTLPIAIPLAYVGLDEAVVGEIQDREATQVIDKVLLIS